MDIKFKKADRERIIKAMSDGMATKDDLKILYKNLGIIEFDHKAT
jgi:hypothetical protein